MIKVANERITTHLAKYGYSTVPCTPVLWLHNTRDVTFKIYVDSFGIHYAQQTDVKHLLNALRNIYTISVDWKGEKYISLTF